MKSANGQAVGMAGASLKSLRQIDTEAAGWLAHSHAWVHPLDLALRDAGLTAPAALAALGAGARALPHTIAQPAGRLGWEEPPLDTLPAADLGVADALALA